MEVIDLNPQLGKLLVQLESGWTPATFSLPAFESIQFNQSEWPVTILGIELHDYVLHVRLKGRISNPFGAIDVTITATSTDNGQLFARVGDINVQIASSESESINVLYCEQWSYSPNKDHAPIAWVGQLKGLKELGSPGNLLTRRKDGENIKTSITNLRLAHADLATYFINPEKRFGHTEVAIAFENLAEEPLSVARLASELPLLRVVLSAPMHPQIVWGVDAQGQTTGAIAFPHEQASRKVISNNLAPVPTTYVQTQGRLTWSAPFYRRLYAYYSENNGINAVSFSLARYGHSLYPNDIDTQFELVAGAVWVLLKNFILIENFAKKSTSENVEGELLDKINSRYSASLEDLESLAAYWNEVRLMPETTWLFEKFGENGLVIADELRNATRLLEYGSLIGYSNDYPQESVLHLYYRVQCLRRAYSVLLAKAIGYVGAVNSFLLFNSDPRPQGWLSAAEADIEDEQEARQIYQAAADITGLSVWPTFELPNLPKDELVHAFATFSEEVRYRMQGKVTARLRRLPSREGEPVYLSFRLMVDKAPNTQVTLFTIELLKKGFEIQDWENKSIRITGKKSLENFQNSLLASSEFKYQIERLLLIEEDIRRGEA